MKSRHFMIVDFYGSGHHSQYLAYVIRYWIKNRPGSRLTLCCVQEAFDQNRELLKLVQSANSGIDVHLLTEYDKPVLDSARNLLRNDRLQGATLAALVNEYRPDELVLMHIDHIQLSLASRKLRFPFSLSISGIYFRPTLNETGVWGRLKSYRKKLLLKRAIRNPHFDRLLSLDPRVEQLRGDWKLPDVVVPIADPIDSAIAKLSRSEAKAKFGIPADATVLLTFGMIDARKGLHIALRALAKLARPESICLFVAGPIDPAYRQSIVDLAKNTPDNVTVVFRDHFVPQRGIPDILQTADAALLLYQNHTGSSNVLVWTAQASLPVIACDEGLIGYNVTKHGLGQVVDTGNPTKVADAINRILDQPDHSFDSERAATFAEANSADEFGRVIFDV